MTSTWDGAIHLADKHNTAGSVFVRLQGDGDKVVGAFCGEPYAREVVWTGERYEDFDGNNPDHLGEGKRTSLRVAVNFFVPAENAMKVIEGGAGWFRDVVKVRAKYGLDAWLFEIERHGEAKNPKTKYSILPDERIDAAMRARIAAAPLHDLKRVAGGEAGGGQAPSRGGRTAPGPRDAPPPLPGLGGAGPHGGAAGAPTPQAGRPGVGAPGAAAAAPLVPPPWDAQGTAAAPGPPQDPWSLGSPGDEAAGAPPPVPPGRAAGSPPADGPAVDPAVAAGLAARLKRLARPDIHAFLATFGVERLRELRASQAAEAGDWIAAREQAAAGSSAADVDPFA
ncbi:MAG TPA: hypothetical protein VFS43_27910 [Polyangiaceae bacterium]|nr:hypothetical protein [Polyangiaceae bacterium]